MNNMFKWDGSEITQFLEKDEVYWDEGIYERNIIWRITYDNKGIVMSELGYVRTCTNTLQCLIDELKTAFKIEKIGTHWFRYKGKMFVLTKPLIKNGNIVEEISLKYIHNVTNKIFIKEVQKIFLFREIM